MAFNALSDFAIILGNSKESISSSNSFEICCARVKSVDVISSTASSSNSKEVSSSFASAVRS